MAPLRVFIVSDLHVDFPENRQRLAALVEGMRTNEADALIVAGDVSHRLDHVRWALAQFARIDAPKLFVAGNHDIWIVREHHDPVKDSWEKLARLGDVCRDTGFHYLEEANVRVGGFDVVGSILWYDYSFASPALSLADEDYAAKSWRGATYQDRAYARWGTPDAGVVERLIGPLEGRLQAATRPIIFVSHHVPREEWVLRRGRPEWDYFNAFMGSRRFEAMLARRGVARFVFGHTHHPVTLIEPGRFVVNNPLGYPRQGLTPVTTPFLLE